MRIAFILPLTSLLVATSPKRYKKIEQDGESTWSQELDDFIDGKMTAIIKIYRHPFDLGGTLKRSLAMNVFLQNPDRNWVCSPVSALLPLGKLVLGTERGGSRNELLQAIGSTQSQVKKYFQHLVKRLRYLPGVTLTVASRLFVSHNAHIHRKYTDLCESVFSSSVEKLNFKLPDTSSIAVNKWVNEQTRGMIPQILKPDDITDDISVLIVNAVYFAGMWKHPFRRLTMGEFYSPKGVLQIPMMTREGTYNYGTSKTLGSLIVEIPYEDDNATFVIVLPEARSGLTLLLRQLKIAPDLLNEGMVNMNPMKMKLTIPKFKTVTDIDLVNIYQKIGLKDIFSLEKSGLTRIQKDKKLVVTKAKQTCVIEVYEKGTEASAASVAEMTVLSSKPPPNINVNRPFLFFIKVREEQLFSGIFTGV